jgi:two-component system sensor histidine kinase UhpB
MSLRVKVTFFFATLLLVSLLTGTGMLVSNAQHSVKVDMEETMSAAAQLITVSLSGVPLSREGDMYTHLHHLVGALSEIRSLHILLFNEDGLLFEGEPRAIDDAVPPEWFIELLLPKVTPLTKRFGQGHMVIYAAPLQAINERWLDIRGILALGLVIFIFVGLYLYWGVGWILKPLERLLDALSGFERGDLHIRLPRFSLVEMDKISQSFNQMGQTLERSIEENRRLAVLVRQSGDAILSLDHTGHITFCNPTAERLFSHQTSVLLGEQLSTLGFLEHHKRITKALEQCETVENLETNLAQPDGKILAILFSVVPLLDVDNVVRGVICTLRDITEHKQAEAAKNQLRESRLLAQHMSDVQEAERRHLARELHDELGQCLTAIKTDAVLIRNRTMTTEPKAFTSAQAIIDVASHIYDVVHNMITRLRPSPLDDLGLIPTLEGSITAWQQRQTGINFKLVYSEALNNLNEATNMTIFRIIQESITNAVRHADATEINISVANKFNSTALKQEIIIDIKDNGKGMEVQDFHSDVDFGLLGMRERAHSLGGTFNLNSTLGEGVAIHITLPLGIEQTE